MDLAHYSTPQPTYGEDSVMILDWIFYHETLYKFSTRHWFPKQGHPIRLAPRENVVSKTMSSPIRQIVRPSPFGSLRLNFRRVSLLAGR